MRITPAFLVILLALPGPAANAQNLDPFLVECLAHMDFLADQAERDVEAVGTEESILAAEQFNTLWFAFGYLVGTEDQCETPYPEVVAEVSSVRRALIERVDARVAAGEPFEGVYQSVWDQGLQCTEHVGVDALYDAHLAVQADGPPCGWTE